MVYNIQLFPHKNLLANLFQEEFLVIETDKLPPHVLGATVPQLYRNFGRGIIWIKKLPGYLKELKEHVVRHEILHNLFPHLGEMAIEYLARLGYPLLKRFKIIYKKDY